MGVEVINMKCLRAAIIAAVWLSWCGPTSAAQQNTNLRLNEQEYFEMPK